MNIFASVITCQW